MKDHTVKRMKHVATVALASALGSGMAWAEPYDDRPGGYFDYAPVVSKTPQYEQVNHPRRECWQEQVGYSSGGYSSGASSRSYVGAVLGGLTGAILGNQVGKGSGRTAAVAVGAATGAIVGDNIDNRGYSTGYSQPRYEERCRMVDNWDRRLTGYNVTYRYQGRDYTAFLPNDPGNRVRVSINVSLAE